MSWFAYICTQDGHTERDICNCYALLSLVDFWGEGDYEVRPNRLQTRSNSRVDDVAMQSDYRFATWGFYKYAFFLSSFGYLPKGRF